METITINDKSREDSKFIIIKGTSKNVERPISITVERNMESGKWGEWRANWPSTYRNIDECQLISALIKTAMDIMSDPAAA